MSELPARAARMRGPDPEDRAPIPAPKPLEKRKRADDTVTGRPTEYSELKLRTAKFLAQRGATMKEIADACSVTVQTIYNWSYEHKEFFDVLYGEDGMRAFDRKIVRSLAERAQGYTVLEEKVFANGSRMTVDTHIPGDVTAQKHWLANRLREQWVDRQQLDVDHAGTIETVTTPDRELALAAIALIRHAAERTDDGK